MDPGAFRGVFERPRLSGVKASGTMTAIMEEKSRVFIECTHTFFNGGNSGIQRVVRNVANNGRDVEVEGIDIRPIVWNGRGFSLPRGRVSVKPYFLKRGVKLFRGVLEKKRRVEHSRMGSRVRRIYRGIVPRPVRWAFRRMQHWLIGLVVGMGSYAVYHLLGRKVRFERGDKVVLVDSTWRMNAMLDHLFGAQRDSGVQVGVVVFDLIPLLMPDTCEEITAKGYIEWFERVVPEADFFVTISEATRSSLHRYLEETPGLRSKPYVSNSFRLGAELDQAGKEAKQTKYLHAIWGTPGRAILCLGTIEPRKNHAYLLDAFDLLRNRGVDVSLIVVGRPGWKCHEILDRMRGHHEYGERIIHFDDASDRDVAEVIERSDCLVCPSVAEGFGLPVVEAMMKGMEVFASDIASFREIKSGHLHLFDLESPVSLADQLEQWFNRLNRGEREVKHAEFDWPDWRQSTEEFLRVVKEMGGNGSG